MTRSEKRVGKQTAGLGRGEREVPALLNTNRRRLRSQSTTHATLDYSNKKQAFLTSLERQKRIRFKEIDTETCNPSMPTWDYGCAIIVWSLGYAVSLALAPTVDLGSKIKTENASLTVLRA